MSVRNYLPLPAAVPTSLRSGWIPRFLGVAAFFLAWFVLGSIFPNNLMPFPIETFELAINLVLSGEATYDIGLTLGRTLVGFAGAMIVGVGFGVAMGANRTGRYLLTPYLLLGLAMPALVWAAIAVLTIGFNDVSIVVATVLTVFPFIGIPIWKAVEDIDYSLFEMVDSFDVSRLRTFRRLVIPSISPALASASRYALGTSFNIVTITEMFAGSGGVGNEIMYTYRLYQYEQSWAWALIFMLVILSIEYLIFKPIEEKVFEYRDDADFSVLR